MRIAALYDIHGNLPGLEAVLKELRDAQVDRVVVGGDVVPGPMAREALRCLKDLDIPTEFIQGNGEHDVLALIEGKDINHVPEQARGVIRWAAEDLHAEGPWISSWPHTLNAEIPEVGRVLFCHATPRSMTEIFTKATPDDRLVQVFENLDADLVVCGHTHMQFDRMIGKVRVVNAGSVGMPFGEPGAYWILLGPAVEFRHTRYDLGLAVERIKATQYPEVAAFAERCVVRPPTEREMLAVFAKSERA